MRNRVVTLFLVQGVCACGGAYKKALPPIEPPAQSVAPQVFKLSDKARQTKLSAIVFDLPVGHHYGQVSAGYGSCYNKQPMTNTQGRFDFDITKYIDLFGTVMKSHGYPVEDEVEVFRDSKERVADLQVAARIVGATINECYPDLGGNKMKASGDAYLKIQWSVYSTLEKKVIYTTVTEGSTYSEVKSDIGELGIVRPALADALERLAMDPKYREVVDPPAAQTRTAAKATAARIKIKRTKEFSGELKSHIDLIKASVATITANKGTGSGFVISEDGTVVTAEHVVSGSKLVKVNTAAGKECYGEVVAASKQRDLAIIHLDCAGLTALPLSRQKLVEGGEVFAIGTPLSEKLQFSVTRGVVSGIRKIDDLEYIQSDVMVHPGSSGGPLLDSRGNVVGVTDLGVPTRTGSLNFFIPVTDLEKYVPVDFE
jgi:S1-C subfamily serine protease